MNNKLKLIPILAILPIAVAAITIRPNMESASAVGPYTGASLPKTIDLNDSTENEIRNYYSNLTSLSESERTGDNLLKNLKPILANNQKYYNYDSGNIVWRMYEITDRDWKKSPASELGSKYNASTNTITNYVYEDKDNLNPYVKSYYMDYTQENQVKAWGNHNQDGYGINREHLWPKSEGFDDEDSGAGARGDPMHLVAANGWANNAHNNNYYGYVDTTKTYTDTHTKYESVGHNLLGQSKTYPTAGVKVFEPQDADKGDIARAIFYMAARYNDIAGTDTSICGANPNLRLTNTLSEWKENGYTSSQSIIGYLGCLDDLLQWNRFDPVDEYEIHRNNILFKNFTNNRNPFIDFPEWAEAIWGNESERVAVDPTKDELYKGAEYVAPQDDGKIMGLDPIMFYTLCGVGAVILLIIVIVVFIKGSKKQKKKLNKTLKQIVGVPTSNSSGKKSSSSKSKSSSKSTTKSKSKTSTSGKKK